MENEERISSLKNWLGSSWYVSLLPYLCSDDFWELLTTLHKERQTKVILPLQHETTLFKIFREVPANKVKVVILGQDPYPTTIIHGGKEISTFDGYAFSNGNSLTISPSLRNIFKEIDSSIYNGEKQFRMDFSLDPWVKQGVMLLNTAHTVEKGNGGSHLELWEGFTLQVLKVLNKQDNIVWLLLGTKAQEYYPFITNKSHSVVSAGHPSPLNRSGNFLGSNCFKKINEELENRNIKPIKF